MLVKSEFLSVFSEFKDIYKFKCSEAADDFYFEALKDIDSDCLNFVFKEALKKYVFMPKIAELFVILQENGLVPEKQKNLSISERKEVRDMEASEALNLAIEAAQKYGRYESVCFQNGAINEAIKKFGGWLLFCDSAFFGGSAEAQGNRKHFKELYLASVARGGYNSNITHFKGVIENQGGDFTPFLINGNCEALKIENKPVAIESKKAKIAQIALKRF